MSGSGMVHLFHRADPGATTTGEGIAAPENVNPGISRTSRWTGS